MIGWSDGGSTRNAHEDRWICSVGGSSGVERARGESLWLESDRRLKEENGELYLSL